MFLEILFELFAGHDGSYTTYMMHVKVGIGVAHKGGMT